MIVCVFQISFSAHSTKVLIKLFQKFAGSRGGAPRGVWGKAPTLLRFAGDDGCKGTAFADIEAADAVNLDEKLANRDDESCCGVFQVAECHDGRRAVQLQQSFFDGGNVFWR